MISVFSYLKNSAEQLVEILTEVLEDMHKNTGEFDDDSLIWFLQSFYVYVVYMYKWSRVILRISTKVNLKINK